MFPIHIRTAWNDYFSVSNPTNYNSQTFISKLTSSDTSVHVSNCLFGSITSSSGHGGAISVTSVSYLLVESTSFFSCKTSSGYGGAVYFYNKNSGQCVLHEVCGNDCYTFYSTSYGQFVYIAVSDTASSKNYVNYSSIARCISETTHSNFNLYLYYGNICCPSVNISLNKCYARSGISCQPLVDSNSVTCSLTYSSFADNIATGNACIQFWRRGSKLEIKSCNILRNTQVNIDNEGTIITIGNLMIEDSCILENKAKYIFYQEDSSFIITLSNCTVDSTSKTGSLIIQNTVTKSFIFALNHMSTKNCHSEYDIVGTLTPITLHPSPSKKQKHYCSYRNILNQPRLRDFFSFHSIFVFNFIHSDNFRGLYR
jgi:hypothetical protein